MIKRGKKQNPKKLIPGSKINPQKSMANFYALKFAECTKWYNMKNKNITNWLFVFVCLFIIPSESSYCFEYPQKSYLNQATLKNTCKFTSPKYPGIENFKPKRILGQDPITWSEQLPGARVMAFSRSSLFLERFWLEFRISLKFHKPIRKTYRLKRIIFAF